jgi:uncharacterized membrane-anchored protein
LFTRFSAEEDEEGPIEEADHHRQRDPLSWSLSVSMELLKRNGEWKEAVKRIDEYKEKSLQDISFRVTFVQAEWRAINLFELKLRCKAATAASKIEGPND